MCVFINIYAYEYIFMLVYQSINVYVDVWMYKYCLGEGEFVYFLFCACGFVLFVLLLHLQIWYTCSMIGVFLGQYFPSKTAKCCI